MTRKAKSSKVPAKAKPSKVPVDEHLDELTDAEILEYGNAIVPMSMVAAVWEQVTGQLYDRTAALHARRQGRIKPMGRRGKMQLYFWRKDIEQAVDPTRPKPGPKTHKGK